MSYERVGFIHRDEPDGTHVHTEVLECSYCGALVSTTSLAAHDRWHAKETVSPS